MSYKVFISYSTKDMPIVEHVRGILQGSSVEVFVAEYSLAAGQPLSDGIVNAIRGCDMFLLLWSSNSKSSEWVPQEIGIAKAERKAILPVVLQPHLELPGFIRDLKYLAAYMNPAAALDWLRQNVFERSQKKQQAEGIVWLGIGAAVLWLVSKK